MQSTQQDEAILRNRYKLTNIVGQGGMGNVYRAEDMRLPGRLCAIKEVQPDLNATQEVQAQAQKQFLQEASILAQLDHPGLPKVSDFFSENGRDYLVMDFVPGKDLRELLMDNHAAIPEEQVTAWADQIMATLAYLHHQEPIVLHRDIKPANIKLTPDGRIKLVDFGLVKVMAEDDARTITVVQGRGTALYTPLEQYGGESGHTGIQTDIYALGATLYHLLMDVPPPDAKARFLSPNALLPLDSRISRSVAEAISWAMEMHPDERPSTIEQLRQVLEGKERPPVKNRASLELGTAVNVFRQHQLTLLLALLLFVAAILLTIL